jgi:pimeloyl-ACP methyl ester carboxylesterase
MFLNEFASGLSPRDMTASAEFESLLTSAADLGIPHDRAVRYLSRQTVLRGMRFHFSEWGSAASPAVLLLHGTNQSSHSWDLVSLHLADRFHVHALDQRGHGDSEWSRELDYSMSAMAGDAAAFVSDVHATRPIVIGHSMGGRVTLTAALRAPQAMRALVIVDSGPEINAEGGRMIRSFVQHNREFDDVEHFIDNVVRYDPYRSREHIARTVKYNLFERADGKYVSKNDHRRVAHRREATLTLDDVRALTMPVLVIRGGNSNVLAADAAERFAQALPRGRLVTVPDAGHNVHSQNTPGFLAALQPFLDEVLVTTPA